MNKKVFVLLLAVFVTSTSYADKDVVLQSIRNLEQEAHRYEIPVVKDDGTSVVITSDTLVSDVRVIIKDVSGMVIFDELVTLLPSDNAICIPVEYQNEKYSIELYYDDNCLYGYFEQP